MKLSSITESLDSHMPGKSCSFKFGDCSMEVLRVVMKALRDGFRDFIVVDGMVYLDGEAAAVPHTWIELSGQVKDPTASQFNDSSVEYNPAGEYKEEHLPQDYVDNFEEQYGVSPSELY